ncbi:MAG: XrtA/PEP-CTERM system TPR-repeat protein PrsT [Rhizobacter sp.]
MQNTKTILSALMIAVLATGCINEKPEDQIKSAKEYISKKDNKSALIQVKNALQQNPSLAEGRYLLGNLLLQEGNASAAEIEFRKALASKYPESIVVPALARSMVMLGQSKKLIEQFGSTRFNIAAADASLQTSLAEAHASLGKIDLSEAALNASLAADPGYVPALMLRARQKAAARDFDAALSTMDGVLAKAPSNPEAWKLKGDLLLYGKNKLEDALTAYRKSLEVDPKFAASHLSILTVLMYQNKMDEATKQLGELKAIAAKAPETKYAEAQLAYQKKDYKTAKAVAQDLLRLSSKNPRILQMAGAIEFQTNSLAQAESYLTLALDAEPKNFLTQKLLISTYLRSGQTARALTTLNATKGKDGLDPRFFALAGQVYLQSGNAKEAEEYFAKALKFDPDNVATRTSMALTHLAAGNSDSGLDELENIADSDAGTTADMALISAHLRRKEYDKALAAVSKLEAKHPDKPVAANLRGRIRLAMKDNSGARKSFEQALSIDPSYFAAAASLAALDMNEKKPDDAKKRFENLLAKNPKNGQALMALAELAAVQGAGKDEVAALLTKAIDANPTEVSPRLVLIDLYLRKNEPKLAIAVAQSAVSALPLSMELLDALGRAQQASGDLNQAASTFAKLVSEQPQSPVAHLRLAGTQHAKKNPQGAEQSVRKALEIKPDFLDAQRALILLNVEAQKYPDAIAVARTIQKQRPQESTGFAFEGDIYAAQKDWSSAVTSYSAGLKLVSSSELASKIYIATRESGKLADAERFAATWIKAHPKDARFMFYLAEAATLRKDYAAAEKQYLEVLESQPENAPALNNLAWVSRQSHKDNAITYAEKANRLAPNQPAFMDTWAMLLSDKGEHTKAIDLQTKALAAQPSNASFRLNLVRIYLAAGEKAKAKAELDELAKLGEQNPSHTEVLELRKAL